MSEYIICVRCRKKSCSSYDSELTWDQLGASGDSYKAKLCNKCSCEFEKVLEDFIDIKGQEVVDNE